MIAPRRNRQSGRTSQSTAFTLVELLVAIAILALLATILLVGLSGVMDKARDDRTRTQIERLHSLLMDKWESYLTRRPPISITGTTQYDRMAQRLFAMRELMRMELPDNKEDIAMLPMNLTSPPGTWVAYRQMVIRLVAEFQHTDPQKLSIDDALKGWSETNEGSECLYLILSRMYDGDTPALSLIQNSEIADTDADGMPEIVDGWGRPILFVRWAPGFSAHPGPDQAWGIKGKDDNNDGITDNPGEAGIPNQVLPRSEVGAPGSDDLPSPSAIQDRRVVRDDYDPFRVDPLRYPRSGNPVTVGNPPASILYPFPLFPLLMSAGPDKEFGIHGTELVKKNGAVDLTQSQGRMRDPYWVDPDVTSGVQLQIGLPRYDLQTYLDNIHNQAF